MAISREEGLCWPGRFALLLMTHHVHLSSSASKVSGGGKTNNPSWRGVRNLPPLTLQVCSMGDLLQMVPLYKMPQRGWASCYKVTCWSLGPQENLPKAWLKRKVSGGNTGCCSPVLPTPQSNHVQKKRWTALKFTLRPQLLHLYCTVHTSIHVTKEVQPHQLQINNLAPQCREK